MTPSNINYTTQVNITRYPDMTYRMGNKTMQGRIEGSEAIRQAVYHILSTERYSNPIYSLNYGVELQRYIGADLEYIKATIQDDIEQALTQDDRITKVRLDSVEQTGLNSVLIKFTVITIYGTQQEEIEIV